MDDPTCPLMRLREATLPSCNAYGKHPGRVKGDAKVDHLGRRMPWNGTLKIPNVEPRFFGNGALNLELLSKRRSELWILAKDDIGEVRKGALRQIVTSSDIQMVNVAGEREQSTPPERKPNPSILRIVDESGDTGLAGCYIRVPDTAYAAYGDLLQSCESRGLVWAGNKITFVASDTISAAFQYEIRLDELVAPGSSGEKRAEGAVELHQPLQAIFEGAYFPIPTFLESFLVPEGDREIRVDLRCDWIDMSTARHWLPREMVA